PVQSCAGDLFANLVSRHIPALPLRSAHEHRMEIHDPDRHDRLDGECASWNDIGLRPMVGMRIAPEQLRPECLRQRMDLAPRADRWLVRLVMTVRLDLLHGYGARPLLPHCNYHTRRTAQTGPCQPCSLSGPCPRALRQPLLPGTYGRVARATQHFHL